MSDSEESYTESDVSENFETNAEDINQMEKMLQGLDGDDAQENDEENSNDDNFSDEHDEGADLPIHKTSDVAVFQLEVPDTITVVPPDERITNDIMSIHERARIIGLRAESLARGDKVFLTSDEKIGLTDAISLAEKELYLRRTPYIIERAININGTIVEHWSVNELYFPITT